MCGAECETLSLPPELDNPDAAQPQELWPPRITGAPDQDFLGDYTPDGSLILPEDQQPEGNVPSEGDEAAPDLR